MIVSAAERSPTSKCELRFDKETVAGLTLKQIDRLSPAEMVRAVETAVMPSGCQSRLQFQDAKTLRRLVYLARRSCRNSGY